MGNTATAEQPRTEERAKRPPIHKDPTALAQIKIWPPRGNQKYANAVLEIDMAKGVTIEDLQFAQGAVVNLERSNGPESLVVLRKPRNIDRQTSFDYLRNQEKEAKSKSK